MGNSAAKEARPGAEQSPRSSSFRLPLSPPSPSSSQYPGQNNERGSQPSRPARSGRPEISFLGIGGSSDRSDAPILEPRRETKQEREARKLERERAARLKERERSMREEHVDGGYLVTQGVYVGPEDFSKPVVRQLMIERRLAPFWRGLNDHSDSWTEHQLVAAARGLPIPAPDEIPPEDQYRLSPSSNDDPRQSDKNLKNLTVPINSRSQSYNSDSSSNLSPSMPAFSLPSPSSPLSSQTPLTSSQLFRGRAKTLASLTTSSRTNSQQDMTPRELQLPKDPFVNGQPIEAYLYKDATECPICFLYYPPYLNKTRCCDQPICSECFVQIKRPDPHPPEHEQNDPNAPPHPPRENEGDGQLVSEPAACPFCVQPEFGVTYTPPSFRRGLTHTTAVGSHSLANTTSAMSSSSSLGSSSLAPTGGSRRRATSLSANSPQVITTDKIRPDWATKLASARAHQARRSAAATALHTAAYLMNNSRDRDSADPRSFGAFSRRGVLRRTTGSGSESPGGSGSPHVNALALLAERHGVSPRNENGQFSEGELPSAPYLAPPRGSSSRRSRIDDLEEMMMMEAIRLSLAAEEDRRKKEEKEAKKEAKRKEKENKKAEKAARKAGLYQQNTNPSNSGLDSPMWRAESGASSVYGEASPAVSGKGKAVERDASAISSQPSDEGQSLSSVPGISLSGPQKVDSMPQSSPVPIASPSSEPPRPSHLRHMSTASSSNSSLVESAPSSLRNVLSGSSSSFDGPANLQAEGMRSATPPGGSPALEPMFNFRSLAAMIGDEDKGDSPSHVENADSQDSNGQGHQSENFLDLNPANSTDGGLADHSTTDQTLVVESKESELIHNGNPTTGNPFTAS